MSILKTCKAEKNHQEKLFTSFQLSDWIPRENMYRKLLQVGYDIDEQLPWHGTLSRTRQLYGEEVFLCLFKQILKLCIDKGMVSGEGTQLTAC